MTEEERRPYQHHPISAQQAVEKGLCMLCRVNPINRTRSKQMCTACLEKKRSYCTDYNNSPLFRQYHRNRYWNLVKQHRCTSCRKELPENEIYKTCFECRVKDSALHRERMRRKRNAT